MLDCRIDLEAKQSSDSAERELLQDLSGYCYRYFQFFILFRTAEKSCAERKILSHSVHYIKDHPVKTPQKILRRGAAAFIPVETMDRS